MLEVVVVVVERPIPLILKPFMVVMRFFGGKLFDFCFLSLPLDEGTGHFSESIIRQWAVLRAS